MKKLSKQTNTILDMLENIFRDQEKIASDYKMTAKNEGDELKQERFYGMELAWFESWRCICRLKEAQE